MGLKRMISVICLCCLLASVTSLPVLADGKMQVVQHKETLLDNGLTIIEEILVMPMTRSVETVGVKNYQIKDGDTLIAHIAFQATFRYDGTSVSVRSKTVTRTDTYEGWSYKQQAFSSSGGTVTLDFKLTKWLILSDSYSIKLTCDANGNLS